MPVPLERISSPQISWIRFVSMIGVIFIHSFIVPQLDAEQLRHGLYAWDFLSAGQFAVLVLYVDFFKFCTIVFFIISGYLFGLNLKKGNDKFGYYLKRLKKIGIPWLCAFSAYALLFLYSKYQQGNDYFLRENIFSAIVGVVFNSAYWFIFNILFALLVIICLSYVMSERQMGILFGLIAVFYAVNIYFGFITVQHSYAVCGYIFYLWLGIYAANHPHVLSAVSRVNTWVLGGICLVLFAASCYESFLIQKNYHLSQFHNTIRISNQLYSVAALAFLLKFNFDFSIKFLTPRQETYGVFLYHSFFIAFYKYVPFFRNIQFDPSDSPGVYLAKCVIKALVVLTATILFVKMLNRLGFRKLAGNWAEDTTKAKLTTTDSSKHSDYLVK